MKTSFKCSVFVDTLCVAFVLTCALACSPSTEQTKENLPPIRTLESKLGTNFSSIEPGHFKPPQMTSLDLTNAMGAAIWGALGRDDAGNIYLGVSTSSITENNIYVYQYNPKKDTFIAQGNVIEELKRAQLYKEDMLQRSMHSKFYLADDGYLYFTSMDTFSQSNYPNTLSKNTSFLWRKKPNELQWEHILSTRESLISVQTDGRYVYVLGSPNHALYQYDTLSRRIKRVTVGSVKNHISQHFLVSPSGHIFVPKVLKLENNTLATDLIEFDNNLNIVDTHPMQYYLDPNENVAKGIVSFAHMKNEDIFFVTGEGALYKIEEISHLKHTLTFTGFLDDNNIQGNYVPNLFTIDGDKFLVGLGTVDNKTNYQWFIHETSTGTTVSYNIDSLQESYLLFGSSVGDDLGNLYVAGVDTINPDKPIPIMLRLSYPSKQDP